MIAGLPSGGYQSRSEPPKIGHSTIPASGYIPVSIPPWVYVPVCPLKQSAMNLVGFLGMEILDK